MTNRNEKLLSTVCLQFWITGMHLFTVRLGCLFAHIIQKVCVFSYVNACAEHLISRVLVSSAVRTRAGPTASYYPIRTNNSDDANHKSSNPVIFLPAFFSQYGFQYNFAQSVVLECYRTPNLFG